MKIRDHPNLVHWPPTWIEPLDFGFLPFDESEELVLKKVELLNSFPNDYHNYIRISAEYGLKVGKFPGGIKTRKTYSSMIIFMKDSEFLDRLYQKLRSSIGKTIREIGNSEI
jgi:hypothetical protein